MFSCRVFFSFWSFCCHLMNCIPKGFFIYFVHRTLSLKKIQGLFCITACFNLIFSSVGCKWNNPCGRLWKLITTFFFLFPSLNKGRSHDNFLPLNTQSQLNPPVGWYWMDVWVSCDWTDADIILIAVFFHLIISFVGHITVRKVLVCFQLRSYF